MDTYKIIRFFESGYNEKQRSGLTLEEAQEHCQNDNTQGIDENGVRFFDGYIQE